MTGDTPGSTSRQVSTDHVPLDFSAFHAMNREAYLRRAERELRSRADAEEAVDATFEQLLLCWQDVLSSEIPAAYAWQVLKNRIMDQARARARRPALLDYAAFETAAMRDSKDPIHELEENWRLFGAVAQLSSRRQDIVVMRHCEGYSYAKIADLLGLTEAGVRSAHRYAIRHLRHLLGTDEEEKGKGDQHE